MFSRIAKTVTSTESLIVGALAPALLFPTPARLLVLAVVPFLGLCAVRSTGQAVPSTPINAALWCLLAMVAVSLAATFDIRFSLGKVSGVILGVLVFWAACRWITTRERLDVALAVYALAGAALAVIGLLGTNWINKFSILGAVINRLPRAIRGVPGAEEGFQPNAVAGCLVLFVPLQIAALLQLRRGRSQSWWRSMPVQSSLMALTTGTLLLTQSRGAWVGLIVAAVCVMTWHSRRTRVLAAVFVSALVVLALAAGPRRVVDLAISQTGPGMAGNVPGRVELWSRAIYAIEDFPFTGMGMNVFRRAMPILYPAFLTSPDYDIAHAHNHLLQAALDLGLPGLVAYSAIWLVIAALLAAVTRRAPEAADRTLASGLGTGLIAHFAFSMTDAIPLGAKVGILFWLTLALAVALHRIALPRAARG